MLQVNEEYIQELLEKLTLEEKIGMVHGEALFHTAGVERLSIPPLVMSDGPSGVRYDFYDDKWVRYDQNYDNISYIPCNSAVAASFNRECAKRSGEVLGEEGRGRGKDVMLAPGINIKRAPYCGRNFEYFSEDPYLVSELAVPMIQGLQEYDIAACVKHFAVNVQETGRMHVDTIVDERTLREIYLPGFLASVKRGNALSVMAAYNKLNGEHCCTSKKLLDGVLRKEWGYDGVIISDWGGVHDTDEAVNSALDVEMDIQYEFDEHYLANPLKTKIADGEYDEHAVDEKVRNILRLMYRLHMIGEAEESSPADSPEEGFGGSPADSPEDSSVGSQSDSSNGRIRRKKGAYNTIENREKCLQTARESIVLLKNNGILPLDETKYKKIAVIGDNAIRLHSNGGGSSEIKALYEVCPLMGIMKEVGGNAKVTYAAGYFVDHEELQTEENWQATSTNDDIVVVPHYEKRHISDALSRKRIKLREEAIELAKNSDLVIYVGGLNHHIDLEGGDRKELNLPYEQDILIQELLKEVPDTILTFTGGSPIAMPWLQDAGAVVWSYYAGMEGGTALADVLFGKVNPSGRLPETFLRDEKQNQPIASGQFGNPEEITLSEGIMVGYRQYDSDGTDVLFPFGYGLSYTDFSYSCAETVVEQSKDSLQVDVNVIVKNDGVYAGKEVIQLYVKDTEASVVRPEHELKGFEKIYLEPGEEKTVTFRLGRAAFDFFDVDTRKFKVEPGTFMIQIGHNSRNIVCESEIQIEHTYYRNIDEAE